MISPCTLNLLFAALASLPATAAPPLYKWTDSGGRVIYASTPPAGGSAVPVVVPPAPSEDEVREAKARVERMRKQLATLENARHAREAAEARARALQPEPPVILERPVYVPQPAIYVPVLAHPRRGPHAPMPPRPNPDAPVAEGAPF